MPRRLSRTQIDKLGERLATTEHDDDRWLLLGLLEDYEGAMGIVQDRLRRELHLEPIARLKTEKTLIEKMRRDRTRLSTMQDLAGVRLVHAMTLSEQDAMSGTIAGWFPGSRTQDRRAEPRYGYRALHVVAHIDDCPVEIQVRTESQHIWADLFESYADLTTREIRYGGMPSDPEQAAHVVQFMELSAMMAVVETLIDSKAELVEALDEWRTEIKRTPIPSRNSSKFVERRRLLANAAARRRRAWEQSEVLGHGQAEALALLRKITDDLRRRRMMAEEFDE